MNQIINDIDIIQKIIKEFIDTNVDKILEEPKMYILKEKDVEECYKNLKKALKEKYSDDEKIIEIKALDNIEKALRYLAFFLADHANHSQAQFAGYLLNKYRTRYWKIQGNYKKYYYGLIKEYILGHLWRPRYIGICTIIVWIAFAGGLSTELCK